MKTAIVRGMDPAEYHNHPAPSWSSVKAMLDCPAAYRHRRDNPPEQTPAMLAGQMAHACALEPETVADRFYAMPDVRRGTKAWKEAEAKAPKGAALVKRAELVTAAERGTAARQAMQEAGITIEREWCEFAVFGQMYGGDARCLPDLFDPKTGMVWDLKFTHSIKPALLYKQAESMAWYGQIASNARLLGSALDEPVKPGGLVVLQTSGAPLAVALPFGPEAIALAESQCHEAWTRLRDCEASGVWPAYQYDAGGMMGVPSWRRLNEEADR